MKIKYEKSSESTSKSNQIKAVNHNAKKMGYINYSNNSNTANNPCRIHYIFVKEQYRKKGIGNELVKMALSEQFEFGCQKVTLDVYEDTYSFFSKRGAIFKSNTLYGFFDDNYHTQPMEFNKPFDESGFSPK